MPKRAVFERSRRELSLDVSIRVHILLVVEQSSLESQSRGCAQDSDSYGIYLMFLKIQTEILSVLPKPRHMFPRQTDG